MVPLSPILSEFEIQGRLLAERTGKNGKSESVLVAPGSLIGAASFLSSSRNRESIRASQTSVVAVFGLQELDSMMVQLLFEHYSYESYCVSTGL